MSEILSKDLRLFANAHIVSVGNDIVANISPIFELGIMTGVVAFFRDATEVLALKEAID